MKKAFLYILQDDKGRYYIGSTVNLESRLKQHEQGNTSTTKRMERPRLVFSQVFSTLSLARAAERKIKTWKRKDYVTKIISDGKMKGAD